MYITYVDFGDGDGTREGNIKMNFRKTSFYSVNWIMLVQEKVKIVNFWVP
jgi:hypothetical protein